MANVLHQVPNPDNVPRGVVGGYQQQNKNIFILQTGIDTCEPFDDGNGTITIPGGGVVDFNGVMFKIPVTDTITLEKPNPATAYWIAVTGLADPERAKFMLVTRPGRWDSAKQGFYLSDGRRTLNWVSLGEVENPPTTGAVFSSEVKGRWIISLKKGWYSVQLRSGLGGGDGERGSLQAAGAGGIASQYHSLAAVVSLGGNTAHHIKVGGNGQDGAAGPPPTSFTGGGSGGGSGGGEASFFDNFMTDTIRAGSSGDGNGPGQRGESSGDGVAPGGESPGLNSGGGGNATPLGGARGGLDGFLVPDGSPGGHCRIFLLTE